MGQQVRVKGRARGRGGGRGRAVEQAGRASRWVGDGDEGREWNMGFRERDDGAGAQRGPGADAEGRICARASVAFEMLR